MRLLKQQLNTQECAHCAHLRVDRAVAVPGDVSSPQRIIPIVSDAVPGDGVFEEELNELIARVNARVEEAKEETRKKKANWRTIKKNFMPNFLTVWSRIKNNSIFQLKE